MTEAIRTLIEKNQHTASAKRRFIERILIAPDRVTQGRLRWTREQLHER